MVCIVVSTHVGTLDPFTSVYTDHASDHIAVTSTHDPSNHKIYVHCHGSIFFILHEKACITIKT